VTSERPGHLSGFQRVYLAAIASVAGVLCLAETAPHGIGISPDSVDYILRARQLAEPGGFGLLLSPVLPASQPPLYPLLLAVIERVAGADPLIGARYLNAALLTALVYASGAGLLAGAGPPLHPLVFGAAMLAVLFARSLHDVFGMAWSEPLFLLASVLFLIALSRYLQWGSRLALLGAGMLAVAAMYTRYSGVTLVASAAFAIPFAARSSAGAKLRDLVAFGALTSLALGVWLLRNLFVTGTATGVHEPALRSFSGNLALALGIAQAHLLPGGAELGLTAKLLLSLALVALLVWVFLQQAARVAAGIANARAVMIPCAAFAATFTAFTLVTASLKSYDPINFRLLAPAFLPLWAIGTLLANEVMQRGAEASTVRGPRRVIGILVLATLLQPARQFAHDFSKWRAEGRGLSEAVWSESELVAYLRSWPGFEGTLPVFSNMRAAIAWHVGARVRNAPARMRCSGLAGAELRSCFLASVDPAFLDAYLIDFAAHRYPYYYTPAELAEFVVLDPVTTTADGSVFRVSRGPTSSRTAGDPSELEGAAPFRRAARVSDGAAR
jgi:hypothetical protein